MQTRYPFLNSLEDSIFMGVAVLVIATSAVVLYHGIASAIDPVEHQAQVVASKKQAPAAPTTLAQQSAQEPCADCAPQVAVR